MWPRPARLLMCSITFSAAKLSSPALACILARCFCTRRSRQLRVAHCNCFLPLCLAPHLEHAFVSALCVSMLGQLPVPCVQGGDRMAPVVGSSRKRMEGEEMRAQAILRRRFSPPDSPRTKMPPGSAPPTCSNDHQELLRTALQCAHTATTCTDMILCICTVPGRNLMQGCAAACRRAAPSCLQHQPNPEWQVACRWECIWTFIGRASGGWSARGS